MKMVLKNCTIIGMIRMNGIILQGKNGIFLFWKNSANICPQKMLPGIRILSGVPTTISFLLNFLRKPEATNS